MKYFFKSFDLLQILVETTCALFISRYCIDGRFRIKKFVKELFVNLISCQLMKIQVYCIKYSKYKNLFRFPSYYHIAEWSVS